MGVQPLALLFGAVSLTVHGADAQCTQPTSGAPPVSSISIQVDQDPHAEGSQVSPGDTWKAEITVSNPLDMKQPGSTLSP